MNVSLIDILLTICACVFVFFTVVLIMEGYYGAAFRSILGVGVVFGGIWLVFRLFKRGSR